MRVTRTVQEYYDAVLTALDGAAAADRSSAAATSRHGGAGGGDDLLAQITSAIDGTSARQAHKIARRGGILVCAQSNGAIDELVSRIVGQQPPFLDEYGRQYTPAVVRLGSRGAQSPCSLDVLVEQRETEEPRIGAVAFSKLRSSPIAFGLEVPGSVVATWADVVELLAHGREHADEPLGGGELCALAVLQRLEQLLDEGGVVHRRRPQRRVRRL